MSDLVFFWNFFYLIVVAFADSKFTLQYARSGCSIQLEDKVILTGGRDQEGNTMANVTVYNNGGFVKDMPRLNTGRFYHGCGHYVNTDNKMVRQHCIKICVYV